MFGGTIRCAFHCEGVVFIIGQEGTSGRQAGRQAAKQALLSPLLRRRIRRIHVFFVPWFIPCPLPFLSFPLSLIHRVRPRTCTSLAPPHETLISIYLRSSESTLAIGGASRQRPRVQHINRACTHACVRTCPVPSYPKRTPRRNPSMHMSEAKIPSRLLLPPTSCYAMPIARCLSYAPFRILLRFGLPCDSWLVLGFTYGSVGGVMALPSPATCRTELSFCQAFCWCGSVSTRWTAADACGDVVPLLPMTFAEWLLLMVGALARSP